MRILWKWRLNWYKLFVRFYEQKEHRKSSSGITLNKTFFLNNFSVFNIKSSTFILQCQNELVLLVGTFEKWHWHDWLSIMSCFLPMHANNELPLTTDGNILAIDHLMDWATTMHVPDYCCSFCLKTASLWEPLCHETDRNLGKEDVSILSLSFNTGTWNRQFCLIFPQAILWKTAHLFSK